MFKYFVFACVLAFAAAAPGNLIASPAIAYSAPLATHIAPAYHAPIATSYSAPLLIKSAPPLAYTSYSAPLAYAKPLAYSYYH